MKMGFNRRPPVAAGGALAALISGLDAEPLASPSLALAAVVAERRNEPRPSEMSRTLAGSGDAILSQMFCRVLMINLPIDSGRRL